MSKKDKDWTFVNDDGSVQIEKNHVVYASAQVHNETKLDSDEHDQDFEIVPTTREDPVREDNVNKSELMNFKGIFIKEDHFANEIQDDGSDIEVVKITEEQIDDHDGTDEFAGKDGDDDIVYEKITLSDAIGSDEMDENDQSSFDLDFEKLFSEENIESDRFATEEVHPKNEYEEDWPDFGHLYESDSENEFDGLTELFHDNENNSAADKTASSDSEMEANVEIETAGIDDGIILSTSVFIIVLCLSVTAGLFIGKGLNYVSSPMPTSNIADPQSSDDVILQERSNENQPKVIVFVNNSMHELNYTTVWISKNAKRHSFDIAVAYQEMQQNYQRLQKRYTELQQQYHIQQHVLLLSKKNNNFPKSKSSCKKEATLRKEYPKVCFHKADENMKSEKNSTDEQKELFWWKTRTAIWRQKYLDLKVETIKDKKKCALMGKRNITFSSCARLLTQYFPDMDVSSLLKSNAGVRLKNSAKMCWKKVLSPVEAMKSRMKDGFDYFGRNVDDAWGKIKDKWDEKGSGENKNKKESIKVKLSSKLRRFRKVFSISNIIGTSFWRRNEGKDKKKEGGKQSVESMGNGLFCGGKSKVSKEFLERWRFDGPENDVTYLPPDSKKAGKKYSDENEEDSFPAQQSNDAKADFENEEVLAIDKDSFHVFASSKPCAKVDSNKGVSHESSQDGLKIKEELLSQKIKDFEERIRDFSAKHQNEEENLRDQVEKFQIYKAKKEKDFKMKKRILENKMRKSSNKYRKEQNSLKYKMEEMERVMKKMQEDYESSMGERMRKMKKKNEKLKRKLKSVKKKFQKEERKAKNAGKKLRAKQKKTEKLLELKEKKMKKELEEEKEVFAKWKEEERGKLMREMAEKWNVHYQEKKKWNERKENLVSKIHKLMKSKREKLHKKEKSLKHKIDKLKRALSKLLQEENEKFQEIREKNRKLKQKQDQVELIKFFYTFGLRKEKEKLEKSKESMKQMKERTVKLENLYNEIAQKYKIVQNELEKERSKEKNNKNVFHQMYYPTVYCPDQGYCLGGQDEGKNQGERPPVVYCPQKDFCAGWGNKKESLQRSHDASNIDQDKKQTSLRETTTAVRPIPPNNQQLSKINPFFIELPNFNNKSASRGPKAEKRKKQPVRPELKKSGEWYFTSMKVKENEKGVPYSWYLYWSKGREGWRSSPGKKEEDNWYLKFMQERERQRSSPVSWYFKQGKESEEGKFNDQNNNWILNRGKGREEAREKEGFYYCW